MLGKLFSGVLPEKKGNNHEEGIRTLEAMGFTRSQVLEALKVCNENIEFAAEYLLKSSAN